MKNNNFYFLIFWCVSNILAIVTASCEWESVEKSLSSSGPEKWKTACGRTNNTGWETETRFPPSALGPTTALTLNKPPHIPGPPVPHLQNEVFVSGTLHQKKIFCRIPMHETDKSRVLWCRRGWAAQRLWPLPCCSLGIPTSQGLFLSLRHWSEIHFQPYVLTFTPSLLGFSKTRRKLRYLESWGNTVIYPALNLAFSPKTSSKAESCCISGRELFLQCPLGDFTLSVSQLTSDVCWLKGREVFVSRPFGEVGDTV